jgi:dienelactone hydrolase
MRRETFLDLLGELPATPEPIFEVLEEVSCEGFVRQKISYQVEDSETISAYLCIPDKVAANCPAIFCHHQHDNNYELGKSEVVGLKGDPTQAYAKELAERGYVTLAPDAIAFEERAHPKQPESFHHHLLKDRLMLGQTLLGKTLHDISTGISIMKHLPYGDPKRVGFIGHSYGGRAALFAPVFDRRITASVSVCGCSSFRYMLDEQTGVQADYCVPGMLKHGDIPDIVKLFEDCALCVIAATEDKWSQDSGDIHEAARNHFLDRELFVKAYTAPHEFNATMKRDAYAFLDRNL